MPDPSVRPDPAGPANSAVGSEGLASRRQQLQDNLDAVRTRIADAAIGCGRRPEDLTLIAVTKTWPASDVAMLVELGATDVGENRLAELEAKQHALPGIDATWHFIGQIQSNKAAAVAQRADVVHALDRPKLVRGLARGAAEAPRPLSCLIQVNLDPEPRPGRGGAQIAEVPALVELVAAEPALVLRGVSGVAPLGGDPEPAFRQLAQVAETLTDAVPVDQGSPWISAGMTGDFDVAIACGATHLRIGTALLGDRPPAQVA